MRFTLKWTDDALAGHERGHTETIQVETLADLRALAERQGREPLVVDFGLDPRRLADGPSIEVYNGYRE